MKFQIINNTEKARYQNKDLSLIVVKELIHHNDATNINVDSVVNYAELISETGIQYETIYIIYNLDNGKMTIADNSTINQMIEFINNENDNGLRKRRLMNIFPLSTMMIEVENIENVEIALEEIKYLKSIKR